MSVFPHRPEESLSEHGSDRPSSAKQKFSRHEKLRMLALRRHLDNLAGQVLESEHIMQTTRLVVKVSTFEDVVITLHTSSYQFLSYSLMSLISAKFFWTVLQQMFFNT